MTQTPEPLEKRRTGSTNPVDTNTHSSEAERQQAEGLDEFDRATVDRADGAVHAPPSAQAFAALHHENERRRLGSEAPMQLASSASRMVAWEWLPREDRITTSAGFADIYGLPALANAVDGFALVWSEDRDAHLAKLHALARTGGEYTSEFRITRPDTGQLVWLEERATAFVNADGRVERVIGMTLDITERKRAEAVLRASEQRFEERARLFEAERRARQSAERTAEQLSRLQAVTAALATALTPAHVADVFIDQGVPAAGAVACWVVGLTADGQELEVLRAMGYPPDLIDAWRRIPLDTAAPVADAVRLGEAVWIETLDERLARYPVAAASDTTELGTWAAVPLVVNTRVIGGIGLSFPEFQPIGADDRAFIQSLAQQCAQALSRAHLQQSLSESEARYRSLVEASAQVVWRAESDGRLLERRARWSASTRIPQSELPEEPLDLVHPDDRSHGEAAWRQAVAHATVVSFEQRVRGADGAYRHWQVRAAPVVEPDGRVREWIGTDTDITERKRSEEALRDYTMRLQQLNIASLAINAAPTRDALLRVIVDQARALLETRMAVLNLVPGGDWSQTRIVVSLAEPFAAWQTYDAAPIGEGVDRLVYDDRRVLRLTQAELEAHPGWRAFSNERSALPPLDGLLAVPLIDSDGTSMGVLQLSAKVAGSFTTTDEALLLQLAQLAAVALENQTLYEQEQAARTHAEEASRLKDDFLATVSHELRTPLTALLGYAQLLQARKRDEAYVARTVDRIVRSAKDQALIIEDLLDISRIVSGKLRIEVQPIDLLAVVRAALDTVQPAVEAKNLHLQVELSPEAGTILGDASRLQQVVWNLLSNAAKFTPAHGVVRVRLAARGRHAELTISDNGQGISAAFLPFVFDRFRQADSASNRSYGGLGIGLSIVRHLIELHGGTVQAASDGEGKGATFTVRLPLAMRNGAFVLESEIEATGAAATFPPELQGLRVLVVDDQPAILELLHEILASCGTLVRLCNDARDGLAMLRVWRPDVLISDIAMPGQDGYWLIEQLRSLAPSDGGSTPAIALTAYVRAEERARVLAAGFQMYVPKPVEPAELRNVLAHLARTSANE